MATAVGELARGRSGTARELWTGNGL